MRKFINTRVYIALGLVSLAASVLLVSAALGLFPDRETAIREGRISLAEALAGGSIAIITGGDRAHLYSLLQFAIERNADIESAARSAGMETLRERCLKDVTAGVTSLDEFLRWRM